MLKVLLIFLTLFLVGHLNAQQNKKFEFWVSSIDKAGNKRLTYYVSDDSVIIKDGPYNFIYFAKNYEGDTLVFQEQLNDPAKMIFRKIGNTLKKDSLKSLYDNLCIMDGLILHFDFEWVDKNISSTISNIYVSKVQPFIALINKNVPPKYKIIYNKRELDQDLKNCDKYLKLKLK